MISGLSSIASSLLSYRQESLAYKRYVDGLVRDWELEGVRASIVTILGRKTGDYALAFDYHLMPTGPRLTKDEWAQTGK